MRLFFLLPFLFGFLAGRKSGVRERNSYVFTPLNLTLKLNFKPFMPFAFNTASEEAKNFDVEFQSRRGGKAGQGGK